MTLIQEVLEGEFIDKLSERVIDGIVKKGIPTKTLLTPEEAAFSLGFTLTAFNKAKWMKTIPAVRVGNKYFYRPKDLDTFAANNVVIRL
jgi:hypothetical protein